MMIETWRLPPTQPIRFVVGFFFRFTDHRARRILSISDTPVHVQLIQQIEIIICLPRNKSGRWLALGTLLAVFVVARSKRKCPCAHSWSIFFFVLSLFLFWSGTRSSGSKVIFFRVIFLFLKSNSSSYYWPRFVVKVEVLLVAIARPTMIHHVRNKTQIRHNLVH